MAAKPNTRYSPTLEALEDRCLLSAGLSHHHHVPASPHVIHGHPGHHHAQLMAIAFGQLAAAPLAADPAATRPAADPAAAPAAASGSITLPPATVTAPGQPAPTPDLADPNWSGGTPDNGGAPPAQGSPQSTGRTPDNGGTPPTQGNPQNTGDAQSGDFGRLWGDLQAQVNPQNASDARAVGNALLRVALSLVGGDYIGALNLTNKIGNFLQLESALLGSNSLVSNAVANDYNQLSADVHAVYYHWWTSPLPGYGGGGQFDFFFNSANNWIYSPANTGPGSLADVSGDSSSLV
jgi:hypothetical protein